MARETSGVNQNLRNANGVAGIDVALSSMFIKFWADTVSVGQTIYMTASAISSGNSAANINITSIGKLRFNYRWSTTQGNWDVDTTVTTGVWHSVGVLYDRSLTTNDPTMFYDGVKKTVGSGLTRVNTPAGTAKSGVDSLTLGENVGGSSDFNGRMAEPAFWVAGLADDQFLGLAADYSPQHYRQNLKWHCRLLGRSSTEPDLIQGADLTVTGATQVAHPRVILPTRPRLIVPAAAAGGGLSIPVAMHSYRQRRAA